jgi:hypothetical protein
MEGRDDLFEKRLQKGLVRLQERFEEAVETLEDEHPLDTLLRDMLEHHWSEADPMVRMVRDAMKIPYPMTRAEARERGLL